MAPASRPDNGELSHGYFGGKSKGAGAWAGAPGFPYRLYTMIHARSEEELSTRIDSIRKETGLSSFLILTSVREFKKTSPDYLGKTRR